MLDPYEQNEVKGTRMPDYSKVSKERDIYGELGWIGNFNVKFSKNNHKLHPSYREFFDHPKSYHNQFNNSTMTNSEFFRQNAPDRSVAKQRSSKANSVNYRTFHSSMRSTGNFTGSVHSTPFVLDIDTSNKYRV